MKTTIGIVGVIALSLLGATAKAQTPTNPATTPVTTPVSTWDYHKNGTVDSISAKYRDKMVSAPAAYTIEQIYPVIGKYESSSNPEAPVITITLDPQNHGVAWIDGLPQGRVKALLRKSPAVYKIPAQKTEEGKDVAEGTLIFDKDLNTLNIAIGKEYNVEDPSTAFATPVVEEPAVVKTKAGKTKVKKPVAPKTWYYTATKINAAGVTTTTNSLMNN